MKNKLKNLPSEHVVWDTFTVMMVFFTVIDIAKTPDKSIANVLPYTLPTIIAILALLITIFCATPSTPNFYKHGAIISTIIGLPSGAIAIIKYPDDGWENFSGILGGCMGYTAIFLLFYLITKHYKNKKQKG